MVDDGKKEPVPISLVQSNTTKVAQPVQGEATKNYDF